VTPATLDVRVEFAGLERERPPLVRLRFDMQFRNGDDGARWFLLPDRLDGDEPWPGEGVSGVDLFELPGERPPLLAQFAAARGGFEGVLLPPGAEASLSRVPIRFWGDPPELIEVEVVVARRVEIAGEDVGAWLGGEVGSAAGASGDAARARRVLRRHSDDFSEFPLAVDVEGRRPVPVDLRGE
jgi:hypothetical protein